MLADEHQSSKRTVWQGLWIDGHIWAISGFLAPNSSRNIIIVQIEIESINLLVLE
jgi:hypothetical protein